MPLGGYTGASYRGVKTHSTKPSPIKTHSRIGFNQHCEWIGATLASSGTREVRHFGANHYPSNAMSYRHWRTKWSWVGVNRLLPDHFSRIQSAYNKHSLFRQERCSLNYAITGHVSLIFCHTSAEHVLGTLVPHPIIVRHGQSQRSNVWDGCTILNFQAQLTDSSRKRCRAHSQNFIIYRCL